MYVQRLKLAYLTHYGLDKWDELVSSELKVTVRPIELVAARPTEHVAAPPTYGPLDAWVTRGPSPVPTQGFDSDSDSDSD